MVKLKSLCIALAVCLPLVGAACSSSSEDSGPAPVAQDQFPTALANAICDNIASCCQYGGAYDANACKQYVLGQNALGQQIPPNRRYDAKAAGQCIADVTAGTKLCRVVESSACSSIIVGAVPPGGQCTISDDCQQPSGGLALCGYQTHTCVAMPRAKAGDACGGYCAVVDGATRCMPSYGSGSGGLCYESDGLFCNAGNVCQNLLHAGDACDGSGCGSGTYCSSSTGICAPLIAAGNPCPDGDGCVTTAFCNNSSVCANKKADGASCEYSDECASGGCAQGVCGKSSGPSIPVAGSPYCGVAYP